MFWACEKEKLETQDKIMPVDWERGTWGGGDGVLSGGGEVMGRCVGGGKLYIDIYIQLISVSRKAKAIH